MRNLERAPKRRAAPSVPIFYPDWLLLSELSRDVADALGRYGRGELLDVGCGERPYSHCKSAVTRWVGFDADHNSSADITGSVYHVPLGDGSIDTVLCTQVLEHLERPQEALQELNRVLKPGGSLILSVPQYWPLHEEPHDFARYTTIGLQDLIRKSGFDVLELKSQGRGARVAGQALNNAILCAGDTFPFSRELWFKAVKAPFYLAINIASAVLGVFLSTHRDVLNHLVIAKKM